jgi:SAM-dependent methyltransferase
VSEPNAQQVAYWNDQVGGVWAQFQPQLDRQLEPLGRAGMAALGLQPGERVLDIGCGAGATTAQLAEAVGASGAAVGMDISRPLLEVARRRGVAATFLEGDAQTYPLEPASFDAAFSRFGVMFFADPTAAFANIRRALRPGGRLAFICWRTPPESPIMTLPMMAAMAHLPPQPPPDPLAPGPFAFADAERLRGILSGAGFADVAVTPHDEKVGGGGVEDALRLALNIGPLSRLLRENPGHTDAVIGSVRQALAAHDGPDGVKLTAGVWIVTARNPA